MDKQDSADFQKYAPLAFTGGDNAIPRTIILDRKDKVLAAWTGAVPLDQLEKDTQKLFGAGR